MAHRSQFPQGEESLAWMKELDQRPGEAIDATYAESFKSIQVWQKGIVATTPNSKKGNSLETILAVVWAMLRQNAADG